MSQAAAASEITHWLQSLRAGDRRTLARTLSYVESRLPEHQARLNLLWQLAPRVQPALRIGFTGAPGAGKSTLVETLGRRLLAQGHRVAVLPIDPSSPISGGSLLADKTRMPELSRDPRAFVRPSASGDYLGGVAVHTDESARICELAGFDVVLIESVGVGQSETDISELVDYTVLVLLPGSGDDLQALKRGITETIDIAVVNKADGDRALLAQQLCVNYSSSLALLRPNVTVPVWAVSAAADEGIEQLVEVLQERARRDAANGTLEARRARCRASQFRRLLERRVLHEFWQAPGRKQSALAVETELSQGQVTLRQAVEHFWEDSIAIRELAGREHVE